MSLPLATVAFPCHNQASYVKEALESVLTQSYSPLEIAISDDESTDGTFEIVQEVVKAYSGPHKVILNRNSKRKGVENYNQLMEMTEGQFVVMAHSDDIALPNRVSKMVEAWQTHGASLVSCNQIVIDLNGKEYGTALAPDASITFDSQKLATGGWTKALFGSSLSWDREVFDVFGPLDRMRSAISTDWILPFRASLLNGVHYIPQPLMKRREHVESRAVKFLGVTDDAEAGNEKTRANRLCQYFYMLDTCLRYSQSAPESKKSELSQLQSVLLGSMVKATKSWSEARNGLMAQKRKCVWEQTQ